MFLQISFRDALFATVLAYIVVRQHASLSTSHILTHRSILLSRHSTTSTFTRYLDFPDLDYGLFPAFLTHTPFSKAT